MKKLAIFLITIFIFSSCESFLDRSPEMGLVEEDVYGEYESFRASNDKLYGHLDDYFHWDRRFDLGSLADETESNSNWTIHNKMNSGGFYSTTGDSKNYEVGWQPKTKNNVEKWGPESPQIWNAFQAIRTANITLDRIDLLEGASEQQKNELVGQAYFFRAWYYFQVLIRWGGMPSMQGTFGIDTDFNALPRRDFVTSAQDCIADLNQAYNLLPSKWTSAELGRVTKGSVLALKEMILLYSASPLMQEGANGSATYSQGLLREAIKVQAELLDRHTEFGAELEYTNYSEVFYSETQPVSKEALFWRHTGYRSYTDIKNHFSPKSYGGGNSTTGPTQNLVDMFEMASGLPITDAESGYDAENPYEGRDPRFYNNILYNGAPWGVNGGEQLHIETFTGGREGKLPRNQASATGYFVKKFWPEGANQWEKKEGQHYMPWVYIRLTQVYLDFAEAANEVYGPTAIVPEAGMSAVDAINVLRDRVGMPDVNAKFTTDKDTFRERIRNERAVELCFEGHRWYDLRRWKTAEEKLSALYKVSITKEGDGTFTYTYPEIENARNFSQKNYWFPIPIEEVAKYENFNQNPGW